ncbi:hypothetical protein GCM10011418_30850 [Sphingobacterium alkalisoli]|nr:hypothetical protein GCM10011418_30850 [Sphingobacterium alkalisoli]
MELIINNKAISLVLFAINFLLLMTYLSYGFVTEDEGIRNIYIGIVYTFVGSLAFSIHYKQNYKTFAFWITVIVSIIFIIATLLFLYFTALGQTDWK